jgi:3-hydroxybutyrate dehydrogenase
VRFKGRVAVVTGGSRGIGKELARAFVRDGADVAICARNRDELARAADEIGPALFTAVCDVTLEADVARFVEQVRERFDKIDILVNNAGDTSSALLLETDSVFWNRVLSSNLTSVFLMVRQVLPMMIREKYGRIVNVASMAAKRGSRYLSAYSAAKHGVLGFTESIALEAVDFGVMVNAVCPGYVDTPSQQKNVETIMADRGLDSVTVRQMMEQKNARRRFVSTDEVAETVLMLSEEGVAVTGQALDLW